MDRSSGPRSSVLSQRRANPLSAPVALSADGKATRRALLALQLVQGMSVEVRAFGDSGDFAAQVQRWAYEQEAFELREALSGERQQQQQQRR